jgi:hypothetical protein
VVEDEPTHLIICSIVRYDPILPTDRMGIAGFWSKTLWMRFLQDTGEDYLKNAISELDDF